MGLVMEGNKYAILTDIAGAEDHYGDMDFKVAGTREGITALQMDIKIAGVNAQIMAEALEQAKKGRLFILDTMEQTLPNAREAISPHAPRIIKIKINPDKIRDIIGPVSVKGFPTAGKLNLESLTESDVGFGMLGVHIAWDYTKVTGGHTSVFGIGAHLALKVPMGM